mmetsp:Transcript_123453/g.348836  ORF Transcript_123453/g.348836 Transcript_123453/m.348836 type:complete len:241 (-) Transcript_123453:1503-2225(-)
MARGGRRWWRGQDHCGGSRGRARVPAPHRIPRGLPLVVPPRGPRARLDRWPPLRCECVPRGPCYPTPVAVRFPRLEGEQRLQGRVPQVHGEGEYGRAFGQRAQACDRKVGTGSSQRRENEPERRRRAYSRTDCLAQHIPPRRGSAEKRCRPAAHAIAGGRRYRCEPAMRGVWPHPFGPRGSWKTVIGPTCGMVRPSEIHPLGGLGRFGRLQRLGQLCILGVGGRHGTGGVQGGLEEFRGV